MRPPYADGCVSPYDVGYVSPIWGWRSESVCGAGGESRGEGGADISG